MQPDVEDGDQGMIPCRMTTSAPPIAVASTPRLALITGRPTTDCVKRRVASAVLRIPIRYLAAFDLPAVVTC